MSSPSDPPSPDSVAPSPQKVTRVASFEVPRNSPSRWWGYYTVSLVALGPCLVGGFIFTWKLGGFWGGEFIMFPALSLILGVVLTPLNVIALRRCPPHISPTAASFALGIIPSIYAFLSYYIFFVVMKMWWW